jgi:hypothetical protein
MLSKAGRRRLSAWRKLSFKVIKNAAKQNQSSVYGNWLALIALHENSDFTECGVNPYSFASIPHGIFALLILNYLSII